MLKRRNRVYRRIAVALTVALLAGQSHAFVLAEENAGGALQTEVTGEADTSTPDHGNAADGGNADNGSGGNTGGTEQDGDNGGTDNQNPDDNGNQGNQQGDGDGQDKCICGTKCAADTVNTDCPVCAADYAACVGKADDAGNNGSENNGSENGDTEDNDNAPENGGQENLDGSTEDIANGQTCVCETACTEGAVNADCPVCAADYANCAKKAEEGENLSVNAALPEMAPASMSDEEAGIATLADEGVEAYAEGDTFYYPENPAEDEQQLKYTVIKKDGDTREVEVAQQGEGAVSGEVTIPESVMEGGVTYQVTSIGNNAFYRCRSLSSIEIPDGVTSIGQAAFAECNGLTSVKIPNSVTSIGQAAFWCCFSLTSVKIPNSVTSIGLGVFCECINLTSIEIPDSVTSIGVEAFSYCLGLTSVKIPNNVTSIGRGAFFRCSSLESVKILGSVTGIEDITFADCISLTSITIPDSVTSIGQLAFDSCNNLDTLQIIISSNQKYHFPTVGEDAFAGLPDSTDRNDIIVIKGADLSDDDLKAADVAGAFNKAKGADGLWYGWSYQGSSEIKDTHKVTITAQKDDTPWTTTTGCDRIFALTKDGGTTFVTNLDAVEAGEYTIYDVTDSGNKLDTGVPVTVTDADVSATVDYYTVAFCYLDDDRNEQTYGDSTDWKPQTILWKAGRVAVPATNPTKADHTFDKWVTASNRETAFDFANTPITAVGTKIYAKWKENTVITYHTVTFYDGTTPYGADTPQKPQSVADGQKAIRPEAPTESIDPDKKDWQFAEWVTEDNGSIPYDFNTPVNVDTNIYASWLEKTGEEFIIKSSATDGGTILPEGDISVAKNGEQSFTITPNDGNKIKAVTVDGKDVTVDLEDTLARAQTGTKTYTFTNVVQNHTIHAEFERDGGGNGTGNAVNADNGNGAGNGQTVAGTAVSSAQAGGGAAAASAGNNAASDGSKAVGGVKAGTTGETADGPSSSTSGQTAGGNGTVANGKEPKTGDASYLEVYATLAMIAGLTYLLLYVMEESRGMSEREKEAFVAAFIRWGKKGGAFRKCCAMAAIFCLLAYYHTIGKRAGENARRHLECSPL